jgi:glycosyltransferase involved in cell wall biosynthesis
MKLLVNTPAHFVSCKGRVFSNELTYARFWKRYLAVFDSVTVVGRVKPVEKVPSGWDNATGSGISFCEVPNFYGPWQYLRLKRKVNSIIENVIGNCNAYILRLPCVLGTLMWHYLMQEKHPYAVEVVADPWDAFSPGGVKVLLRPIWRRKMAWDLIKQCQGASAACYVTEYSLQKRYPPGGWSTYCSDVELADKDIVDESALELRTKRVNDKSKSGRPWNLCYVGSMGQLYKAPDVLLYAVANCIKKGLSFELTMVGDGYFRPRLERQARELGIGDRVKFIGCVPAGECIFQQLDKADLFVLPSRTEGLPRALVEAMARGVPSIGSTVGGFPELLDAEDLVMPNDVQTLADKIAEVLSNTSRLTRMSIRNLETVKAKFNIKQLERRRIEFYQKVAALSSFKC